jgi:hypothetical protein
MSTVGILTLLCTFLPACDWTRTRYA